MKLKTILSILLFVTTLHAANISLQDKHGIKDTSSLLLKVQMNLVPNAYIVHSFGRNSNVGITPETLSETSVLYTYPMGFNSDAKLISLYNKSEII